VGGDILRGSHRDGDTMRGSHRGGDIALLQFIVATPRVTLSIPLHVIGK